MASSSRGAGDLSPRKNNTGDDDNNNKEVRLFQFESSKVSAWEWSDGGIHRMLISWNSFWNTNIFMIVFFF